MSPPQNSLSPAPDRPWRWVIIALIFLGTVVNYFDRLAVPTLAPVLRTEFHLTNVQYAWIANAFAGTIARSGRKIETVVLDDRSSDAEVQRALQRASRADLVIASLYGRVRTGQARSVGLPEPGANALSVLIKGRRPLVGISFGNPYLLQSFPELRTYVVAYGDMPSLQQAAARALLGEIDITGKLPISLPGLYPRGTGIQLKRGP